VRYIRRARRKYYWAEEEIGVVLDGLRGESSIAELCRREGIAMDGSRASQSTGSARLWRPVNRFSGPPTKRLTGSAGRAYKHRIHCVRLFSGEILGEESDGVCSLAL